MSTFSKRYYLFCIMLVVAMITGCATVADQKVDLFYQKSANASGGSGDLYLVQESRPSAGGAGAVQWIIGRITNKDGDKIGNVVTDLAPMDLLADALRQELEGAGYHVIPQPAMPPNAAKGIVLKSASSIKLDEVKSTLSAEASCKVELSLEPWRNGRPINKVDYEADYTDTGVTSRDELLSKTLARTLRMVMTRSVPEIVRMLEQK